MGCYSDCGASECGGRVALGFKRPTVDVPKGVSGSSWRTSSGEHAFWQRKHRPPPGFPSFAWGPRAVICRGGKVRYVCVGEVVADGPFTASRHVFPLVTFICACVLVCLVPGHCWVVSSAVARSRAIIGVCHVVLPSLHREPGLGATTRERRPGDALLILLCIAYRVRRGLTSGGVAQASRGSRHPGGWLTVFIPSSPVWEAPSTPRLQCIPS
jgi:hypothetical protein